MPRRAIIWLPIVLLLLAAVAAWALVPRSTRPNLDLAPCGGEPAASSKATASASNDRIVGANASASELAGPKPADAGDFKKVYGTAPPPPAEAKRELPLDGLTPPPQPGDANTPTAMKLPEVAPTGAGTVKQPGAYEALKGAPEPAQWDEHWSKRGVHAPEMVSTAISGKLMLRETSKGLGDATVGLMTFFPTTKDKLSPLLPVLTEFKTNADGAFSGTVPTPKEAQELWHMQADVGLFVTHGGRVLMVGGVVRQFVSGKKNELGVLWVSEVPKLRVIADATRVPGVRQVIYNGLVDPRCWHASVREETLAMFPYVDVPDSGTVTFATPFEGTMGGFVSLRVDGVWFQTRGASNVVEAGLPDGATHVTKPVFPHDPGRFISGQVLDEQGHPLAGAIVSAFTHEGQYVTVNSSGWFQIEDLAADFRGLVSVSHDDYLGKTIMGVKIGDSNLSVSLTQRKPLVPLRVLEQISGVPINAFSITVIGASSGTFGPAGTPLDPRQVDAAAINGVYTLKWDTALISVTVEKAGFMPVKLTGDALKAGATGFVEVSMRQSRVLEVRPRDYTAVGDATKWFFDPSVEGVEGSGIWTAWADQTIEWEIDFGDAPAAGVEGGWFDLVAGCTNKGIVDNSYMFHVEVWVGDDSKGTMSMVADSANEQTGRISLGAQSGKRRVKLIWRNDAWIEGQLDANIRYASLKFIETSPG